MPAAGARPKATKIYLIDCAWSRNLPKTQHTSYTHTLTLLKYFSSASHDSHFHTIWLVILYFYYFYIFFIILRFSSLSSSCSIQSRFLLEQVHRFQRSISWKRILFRLVKKWYHRCLSICLLLLFHTRGSSQVPEKRNQLFGTIDNLLTHFEWENTDEEVSVIVGRRVLFKRNIMRRQWCRETKSFLPLILC